MSDKFKPEKQDYDEAEKSDPNWNRLSDAEKYRRAQAACATRLHSKIKGSQKST